MKDKSIDMQEIFNGLSDQNKDILLTIAKSVKTAQEMNKRTDRTDAVPKQTA